MRIVVIGGFGNFGARICRRLRLEQDFDVVAAGRHPPDDDSRSARLDTGSSRFAADLAALRPGLVIHCAGPFQGQDYRVAQATIDCGAHYLDLADGRAFVSGFGVALEARACAAGLVALSGASTLPALSSAVIDTLRARFMRIDAIDTVIAPGQKAPRGVATMTAVLGYAGRPFRWMQDGEWRAAHGWQQLRRVHLPFGRRWAAACDVPDLELFPKRYGARSVEFRAALEFGVEHWALWLLAACRRVGLFTSIARWAAPLDRASSWLDPLGGEWGGMTVEARGRSLSDRPLALRWSVQAPALHGPEIPCMAAELLALRLARGANVPVGARACVGELPLDAFDAEFQRWGIHSEVRELTD